MGTAPRNRNREKTPFPIDTVNPYRPAVKLDQFLHQRKADACALVGAPARAFDTIKTLKDVGHLVCRDANTGIAHRKLGRFTNLF